MKEHRSATILVIEDVEDNRGILRQVMRRMGLRLLEAEDGAEGLALARAEHPDLILMDLDLPVIDGWEVARRLKTDPATGAIPIVALTAHAMAGDEERSKQAGCDHYVTKPFSLRELQGLIEDILEADHA